MARTRHYLTLPAVFVLIAAIASPLAFGKAGFLRGDANRDGGVDISDPIFTLQSMFLGEGSFSCEDAADANDDGVLDLADPIFTLMCLFVPGNSLPPPKDTPGQDETPDSLTCGALVEELVLSFRPRQCESYPWETGGLGEEEALRSWIEGLGVTVNWVEKYDPGDPVCMACGCPRGYTLTVSIAAQQVPRELIELGFDFLLPPP
jgi:hypothetical protein